MKICGKCGETKPKTDFEKWGRRCRSCAVAHVVKWRRANPEKFRANAREWMRRQRLSARTRILEGYGGRCRCCGESEPAFLALDHVNDDGANERAGRRSSHSLYVQAIREGFPARYQLLCHNCNMGKAILGVCPHQDPAKGRITAQYQIELADIS